MADIMKMRIKRIIKSLCFLLILLMLFVVVQRIIVIKWDYPVQGQYHTARVKEYNSLKENSIQVLFAGTSHVQYSIIPMKLYQDRKIVSYNMAVSGGGMSATYYQLKNLIKTQHPELVVLDVSAMFFDEVLEEGWTYVLDTGYPFGIDKIQASFQSAKEHVQLEGNDQPGEFSYNFLSHMVPLISNKDRWKSLNMYDFDISSGTDYTGKGYAISTRVQVGTNTIEGINEMSEAMKTASEQIDRVIFEGIESQSIYLSDTYKYTPDGKEVEWLLKIRDLLYNNGIRLQLIKVPVYATIRQYASAWTKQRSSQIKKIADELGLPFLDLMYDIDLGIDAGTDYYDIGAHMNYNGACKVTEFIGDFLESGCGITGKQDDYYDSCISAYNDLKDTADLCTEFHWNAYFTKLKEIMSDKVVILAMKGGRNMFFSEEDYNSLKDLGLQMQYSEDFGKDAFVGIIQGGTGDYEREGNGRIVYEAETADGKTISLKSIGAADTVLEDPCASIQIDHTEYSQNWTGLNIVVYDNKVHQVVDCACFFKSSEDEDFSCQRDTGKVSGYVQSYEYQRYHLKNQ